MHTRWIPVVTALGASLALSGCGNLASRADDGCQMTVRSAEGWLISGVNIPVSRAPDGASVTIGSVTYNADQAYELSRAAQELDQVRLQNCATIYAPKFSDKPDAAREPYFGRVIAAADQMAKFGTALKGAKSVEAGLAASQEARQAAALIRSSAAAKKPDPD